MFSYVGGKHKQARWINSFIPEGLDRYSEVFGGAMWVYIMGEIDAKEIIYNDVNAYLYNLWSCMTHPEFFLKYLEEKEPKNKKLFHAYLKEFKDKKYDTDEIDFEVASRYAYCLTQSFSGAMSSFSSEGDSSNKYMAMVKRVKDKKIQNKLKRIKVLNTSFEDFMPMFDIENGLMYLDPPYFGKENYYKFHSFTVNDHKKLIKEIKKLKGKWMLSYYYFDELEREFPREKYNWETKKFSRFSSYNKKGRNNTFIEKGEEILIMNYKPKNKVGLFFK